MTQPTPRYAPAAGAAAPHALHTDAAGLETGLVALASAAGPTPAYFARPQGGAHWPIILVAQEIFGLHEHIRDIVRRFAKHGYFAIAPDYFAAHGDPLKAANIEEIRAIVAKVPDLEAMADFRAAFDFAADRGGDANRAAITGFCWGGRMAWLYAAHDPRLKACVPWYGRLAGEETPNQPSWPINVAHVMRVPSLGLYGGADPSIPLDAVEKMRAELRKAPVAGEIIVYDGAPHAFFADYRESYRESAAKDAFARALGFLRSCGL